MSCTRENIEKRSLYIIVKVNEKKKKTIRFMKSQLGISYDLRDSYEDIKFSLKINRE